MVTIRTVLAGLCVASLTGGGCVRVRTDPVEVKPIHITVDVNLKVQRELDGFFGDLDRQDPTAKPQN